ncbi:MAG TPA: sugar phosphate isomerase/epimerase [Tepidisphaeraceae bacterium]|nr:sugar phosphate isomerase/epimerase [Tepidisphaeraceae bacterium]
MPTSQIAAQLYTLREFTKTPADVATTLKKVKRIGYEAVQCSGMGKIDPKELATMLRDEGLTCCATHVPLERMKNETQAVIDEHKLWGCKYTAVGGFFPKNPTVQDWHTFARDYNAVAGQFKGSGLELGYHNHSHELARFDGKTGLQILLGELDESIWWEIDTYWIVHGGADPIEWIRKVRGRMPCVHLKDMAITPERQQLMAEVGEGNLNWPGILAACREIGVQWYIVEQDICQRDPFESLKISLENLKGMGVA